MRTFACQYKHLIQLHGRLYQHKFATAGALVHPCPRAGLCKSSSQCQLILLTSLLRESLGRDVTNQAWAFMCLTIAAQFEFKSYFYLPTECTGKVHPNRLPISVQWYVLWFEQNARVGNHEQIYTKLVRSNSNLLVLVIISYKKTFCTNKSWHNTVTEILIALLTLLQTTVLS